MWDESPQAGLRGKTPAGGLGFALRSQIQQQ